MHEMKCFMILCEKLMTAEKRRGEEEESKALKTQYEAKKEIEFINIDTDGRDSILF